MNVIFFARRKKRTRTPQQIARALTELGHRVRTVHYGRWTGLLGRGLADRLLLARAAALRPGLVLVWKDCISPRLLAELNATWRTAVLCVDWFADPPEPLCEVARLADLFLLTNSGQLDQYRQLGVKRPLFWPQGFDAWSYRPADEAPAEWASDVAFIGKPAPPHRVDLLKRLDERFDLGIWGPEWAGREREFRGIRRREVRPPQYGPVCRASKVMFGCDAARGVPQCFSNRTWLTLGCRGFLVTDYVPGLESLFENHKHLVWYRSADECVELIEHYLARPDERARIAQAGCDLVREQHTYVHRARELLALVDALPVRG